MPLKYLEIPGNFTAGSLKHKVPESCIAGKKDLTAKSVEDILACFCARTKESYHKH